MTVHPSVLSELARLRGRLPELSGTVLATADGLVVAHDAHGLEPETLAAMSAAHLGLARRFADAVDHGSLRETVVTCAGGYITTYAAGDGALMTVVCDRRANLARVHLEARRTLTRLAGTLPAALDPPDPPPDPPKNPPADPRADPPADPPEPARRDAPGLARRTPMATVPRTTRRPSAG